MQILTILLHKTYYISIWKPYLFLKNAIPLLASREEKIYVFYFILW